MTYPFDPELAPWIEMMPAATDPSYESLLARRIAMADLAAQMPAYEPVHQIDVYDTVVPGEVPVRVYSPAHRESAGPGLLYIHGVDSFTEAITFTTTRFCGMPMSWAWSSCRSTTGWRPSILTPHRLKTVMRP